MDTLRAEWKKCILFREVYAALGLAAVITLWQGLPAVFLPCLLSWRSILPWKC